MDTVAIAGASLLMRNTQTQQAISMSIMKQAADQQKQLADLLAQSAAQVAQLSSGSSDYSFSTFA
jgi:hypothetical protein